MEPNAVASRRGVSGLERSIVQAAEAKGLLDADSDTVLPVETEAANWSVGNNLYISLQPSGFSVIPASACDDIREGRSQCCRVGPISLCACGHSLAIHEEVKLPRRPGYIKPPKCSSCKKCSGFSYLPMYPEECGQWWLRRRRDFNLVEWRKRVRANPDDYACIGCNLKLSDHETLFETREMRQLRGASVNEEYIPLADYRINRISDHNEMDESEPRGQRLQRYKGVGK